MWSIFSIFLTHKRAFFTSSDTSLANLDDRQFVNATETAVFVEDEWTIRPGLRLNAGFRFNLYQVNKKSYTSPEPRLSLAYDIAENLTVKAAYSQMQQNIHLLVNANTGFQADFWVPSTDRVRPQRSAQISLGLFKYFPKYDLEASIEIYNKNMTDLIDVKDGTNLISDVNSWDKVIELSGTGQSKGIEFFCKKIGTIEWFYVIHPCRNNPRICEYQQRQNIPFSLR
ncbi:MAG: TonB-dependent receptor [Saprospiraceae bacterium]|nr:TonB-dependent receptor [Saprospiraceae bacterium]